MSKAKDGLLALERGIKTWLQTQGETKIKNRIFPGKYGGALRERLNQEDNFQVFEAYKHAANQSNST